ncbi:MAG: hypothetical protein KQJ78_08910 [Deltaproteobacteria bacterium]|nr:hypothetical protein [Deltaproteobacteria bacterium]
MAAIPLKRVNQLLLVLVLAAGAGLGTLAYLERDRYFPPAPPPPPPVTAQQAAPPVNPASRAALPPGAVRNLFQPSVVPTPTPAGPPPSVEGLQILGVVLGGDYTYALIENTKGQGELHRVYQGGLVNGMVVLKITPDGVMFQSGGKKVFKKIYEDK